MAGKPGRSWQTKSALARDLRNFMRRVQTSDGCWLWRGAKFNHGYGKLLLDGKFVLAHRVSWELWNGAVTDGLWVLHKCDTPLCVNPSHLYLGTALENARDRVDRHREGDRTGDKNGRSKLTWAQVREIRALHSRGEPVSALSRRFGVAISQAREIVRGESWKEVPA